MNNNKESVFYQLSIEVEKIKDLTAWYKSDKPYQQINIGDKINICDCENWNNYNDKYQHIGEVKEITHEITNTMHKLCILIKPKPIK